MNTMINKEWPSAHFDESGIKCSSLEVFKGNFLELHLRRKIRSVVVGGNRKIICF